MFEYIFQSPIGKLFIQTTNNTLKKIEILNQKQNSASINIQNANENFPQIMKKTIMSLQNYFNKNSQSFEFEQQEIDISSFTPFQQQVFKAIQKIKYGETKSYKQLAIEAFQDEKKSRPLAQACGKNQILLIIPCHRVVGSNDIGGFSYGLEMKEFLLNFEQKS